MPIRRCMELPADEVSGGVWREAPVRLPDLRFVLDGAFAVGSFKSERERLASDRASDLASDSASDRA